jgi:hypothetical protein
VQEVDLKTPATISTNMDAAAAAAAAATSGAAFGSAGVFSTLNSSCHQKPAGEGRSSAAL